MTTTVTEASMTDTSDAQLTAKQQKVFDYICRHLTEKQCTPTAREIQEHLGLKSVNGGMGHLNGLEKKGFIARNERKARNIRVLKHTVVLVPAGYDVTMTPKTAKKRTAGRR